MACQEEYTKIDEVQNKTQTNRTLEIDSEPNHVTQIVFFFFHFHFSLFPASAESGRPDGLKRTSPEIFSGQRRVSHCARQVTLSFLVPQKLPPHAQTRMHGKNVCVCFFFPASDSVHSSHESQQRKYEKKKRLKKHSNLK